MNVRISANEGVLGNFLCAGSLANHHDCQTKYAVLIPLHQMPKRLPVAATDVANHIAV
jgi:hypothetical protein